MRRTRWTHAAGFKAKVAMAANPDLDPRHERAANLVAEAIAWIAHSSNRWIPEGLRGGRTERDLNHSHAREMGR